MKAKNTDYIGYTRVRAYKSPPTRALTCRLTDGGWFPDGRSLRYWTFRRFVGLRLPRLRLLREAPFGTVLRHCVCGDVALFRKSRDVALRQRGQLHAMKLSSWLMAADGQQCMVILQAVPEPRELQGLEQASWPEPWAYPYW